MGDDVTINVRERGARKTSREVDKVGRSVRRLGPAGKVAAVGLRASDRAGRSAALGMRAAGSGALYAGAALGVGLVVELKRSVDAWQEKRKIVDQTGAVLKSTSGAAHVTASEVDRLSTSLSRKSGMDDEAITSAQNLLLTFRDIRNEAGAGNDIFTQTTKATVDLAAAMHMDLPRAALQLGKALNDPERGFKRLQRIGVAFSATQEKQIHDFAKVGDRASAQRVILAELRKEFGGSAAAQATALDRLKVSWGNIEESIGRGVSPAVDAVADKVDHFLVKAEPKVDALGARLGDLFKRDDLSLEDKLTLGSADVQRTFRPWIRSAERELKGARLGDHLNEAIDMAAPHMLSTFGRLGGQGAEVFIKAWWHSDIWGKVISGLYLGSKMGAFSGLGRKAGGKWGRGFILGAVAAAAAYEAAQLAAKVIGGGAVQIGSESLAAGQAADNDPATKRARRRGTALRQHPELLSDFYRRHPTDRSLVRRYEDISAGPLRHGEAGRRQSQESRRIQRTLQAHGYPGLTSTKVILLKVDGKTLAKVVDREHADKKARR